MNEKERQTFHSLLFSELCLIPVTVTEDALSDEALVRAVTAHEELLSLGFRLSPADIVLLSRCKELDTFPAYVRDLMGDVNAEPMYPDFPKQVMRMSKAVYRFQQLLHYMSTYGLEEITGEPVLRGWLPDTEKTEKTKTPKQLLESKTVQLVRAEDYYSAVFCRILSKTERMTAKEYKLISLCLPAFSPEQIAAVSVPFKENLAKLFLAVAKSEALSAEKRRDCLHQLCKHTGDVWKCTDALLHLQRFRLHTSEKRLIVKLLESYPIGDFKSNLILSNLHREKILLMLNYLDFNTYSRSAEHKEAVRQLRAGELRSWQSDLIRKIRSHAPDTLEFIAKRPGMMLRMMTLLLRNGYSAADISAHFVPRAAELRTQTLVTMLNFFDRDIDDVYTVSETAEAEYRKLFAEGGEVSLPAKAAGKKMTLKCDADLDTLLAQLRVQAQKVQRQRAEYPVLTEICKAALEEKLRSADTPVKNKKVAFRFGDFAPEYSLILTNDKSDEGGYIPSGVAYRIPADADRIRFFVYWNDKCRSDVDLHTVITKKDGERIRGGWNADFSAGCMAFSGDITHSDAAEYMDIDLSRGEVDRAAATVNLYCIQNGKKENFFCDIETCYVGCMAVRQIGEDVKQYHSANCFFTHHLDSRCKTLLYGFVDAVKRCVVFIGKPLDGRDWYAEPLPVRTNFSLLKYLEILVKAQGLQVVSEEEADYIFVMGKPASEKELSLRDCNYFMDA